MGAKAEFEIPEGHTFLEGIAVVRTTDRKGRSHTAIVSEGEPSTELMIGLLITALDRVRDRNRQEYDDADDSLRES